MLSLKDRIENLEGDLNAKPMRISVHSDLPFAILRYDPSDEWEMREEARRLAVRLEGRGWHVHVVSLAELLWEAIGESEGLDAVVELEREHGFDTAQKQVMTYLSDGDWHPLPIALAARLAPLDPEKDLVFLVRAAALAPAIYPISRLLDEMHGRTHVPAVLFYPGTIEGTTGLNFMGVSLRAALGNYRVKIYG